VTPPEAGPLDGVRIVDLTTVLSGPIAAAVLADQGADVIKVEGPGWLDLTRQVSPRRAGFTEMYLLANRGKRSLVVDLAAPDGVAVLRRLAASADVVMQNFRPGVAERMGIGPDDLRAAAPDLVYLSITGFGPTGPLADLKVYDNLVQAVCGLACDQGRAEASPAFVANLACDKITALTAAQAVTAALLARANGRGGQHVELSMLDASIAFLWPDAAQGNVLLGDDVEPASARNASRLWRHVDGWSTCAPVTDAEFRAVCEAVGRPDVADDPRFTTQAGRLTHPEYASVLRDVLQPAAAGLTVAEMLERLSTGGVPAVAAVPIAEVHTHEQVRANETFRERTHPVAGALREPRGAARFRGTPGDAPAPAPALGEHTDQILAELGYDPTEIGALRAAGTVA
jgi:crotonobetainyl-CoA:carnitine CoA-transferase CaiB-like acyl-CoA transferase